MRISEFKGNWKGDIYGGLAAGIVTLPIALAFGQASGLGAMAGLYGAIILGLFGTIFGGTQSQISSPVGVILVTVVFIIDHQLGLSAQALGLAKGSDQVFQHALPYILLTFFLAGLFQMILGLSKLGRYINYIPYPVVSGFSTGIGLLIIIIQLKDLLDIDIVSYKAFDLTETLNPSYLISIEHGVFLAVSAILIIVFFPRVTKSIPATLMALIFVSILPYVFGWDDLSLVQVPEGERFDFRLEVFEALLDVDAVKRSLGYGFSLAIISSINTLLTSLAADNLVPEKHNSNQELVGQGLGNLLSSLFGGMPGGGAVACTVTNIQYGGRTKLSGIVSTIFLAFVWLAASDLISLIPVSVLDGMLIYVGYLIIDKKAIRDLRFMPLIDTIIMIIVIVFTAYGELLYAVIAGLSLASIYFMKKMADVVELDIKFSKVDRLVDHLISSFDDSDAFRKQVYIKNIKGPVFFGLAARFSKSIGEIKEAKAVIFNMSNVPYIDQSGLYTLEREISGLKKQNMIVCLSEVNKSIYDLLVKLEIIPKLVEPNHIFPSIEENIIWLREPGHLDGKIYDKEEIYVPEAFTPNEDGVNDTWNILNIENYPNCVVNIFTREGDKVFNSKGYEMPWEGRYNDKDLPIDRYRYSISLNDIENRKYEGYVSIFK